MRLGICVVGLLIWLGNAPRLHAADNSKAGFDLFQIELTQLRDRQKHVVGQEARVAEYETFVEHHLGDPRVADVMIQLGSLCENDLSTSGAQDGLRWHRAAAARAAVGSKTWVWAQELVVGRLRDREERFAILDRVAEICKDDPAVLARVEGWRQRACVEAGDLAEAERHCLALVKWHQNHDPRELEAKGEIDSEIRRATYLMVQAWIAAPWPQAERVRKVTEFRDRNYIVQKLFMAPQFKSALKFIGADGGP